MSNTLEPMSFTFAQLWNQSLEKPKDRPTEPRSHIWASELGGPLIDRYLKMKGVQPTNPPNPRSRRKFEAGNIWEALLSHVLNRAGILLSKQDWLKYEYPGLLPVTGKLDFLAGGKPNYERSIDLIQREFSWLPPFIKDATLNITNTFKNKYPGGLKEIVLEIKTCSSFMFEIYERQNSASPHHCMQLFHYLKAKDMSEGHIVYISKDDCRILELGIFNPSSVEKHYKEDIEKMTYFVRKEEMPPKEKPIVFDKEFKKFSANWKVGYSNYLTMLYSLENQMEFDNKYKPIAERMNRVLGRIKEGKEMTDKNKDVLKEIEQLGFKLEEIKEAVK